MLQHKGVCLLVAVIILCITLSYANHLDDDIYEEDEEQGKLVDIQQLHNKVQPAAPSRPRPPRPRPSNSGNHYSSYPPPFYWPPPPYYPPPHRPSRPDRPHRPDRPDRDDDPPSWTPPRRPSCGRSRPLGRNLRALCGDFPSLPICRDECRCCGQTRACDPLCSGTATPPPLDVYCSQECLLNRGDPDCVKPPLSAILPLVLDCDEVDTESSRNCILFCEAYPQDARCSRRNR